MKHNDRESDNKHYVTQMKQAIQNDAIRQRMCPPNRARIARESPPVFNTKSRETYFRYSLYGFAAELEPSRASLDPGLCELNVCPLRVLKRRVIRRLRQDGSFIARLQSPHHATPVTPSSPTESRRRWRVLSMASLTDVVSEAVTRHRSSTVSGLAAFQYVPYGVPYVRSTRTRFNQLVCPELSEILVPFFLASSPCWAWLPCGPSPMAALRPDTLPSLRSARVVACFVVWLPCGLSAHPPRPELRRSATGTPPTHRHHPSAAATRKEAITVNLHAPRSYFTPLPGCQPCNFHLTAPAVDHYPYARF